MGKKKLMFQEEQLIYHSPLWSCLAPKKETSQVQMQVHLASKQHRCAAPWWSYATANVTSWNKSITRS